MQARKFSTVGNAIYWQRTVVVDALPHDCTCEWYTANRWKGQHKDLSRGGDIFTYSRKSRLELTNFAHSMTMYEIISLLNGPSHSRRIFLLQEPSRNYLFFFFNLNIYVTGTRRPKNLGSNLLEPGSFMFVQSLKRLSFPARLSYEAYRSWCRDGKEARMWLWPRLYLHLGLRMHGVTTPITLTSSQRSVYSIRTTLSYLKINDSCVVIHSKVN